MATDRPTRMRHPTKPFQPTHSVHSVTVTLASKLTEDSPVSAPISKPLLRSPLFPR